ncbi:unnamed protein product [Spirodela intermedia]|uniref:Tr-type G domain-containing protein n=1 Tax=Spirodela intermedia TaxID=51605 RepID=A0A7I8JAJ7_SPIIN|nr:unnamed protein product [Spirodela intermedia]CAA6667129.1 unnamed protein product [Spirodela intermedia]
MEGGLAGGGAMGDCRKIRNICILAHVDHGKTTLADHLIASSGGGLVHPKLAGRLRFMDYLDEEQRRAITMKSSSIALQYQGYSVNLIDSPGHMDFCSEVSTAVRMSDGALVLVDAVEGVHIQTHAVLRQAWVEKLTPCLVLNKIDRLITELKFTPMEAYTRLQRIVHEVNGIMSAYRSEKYLSDVDSLLAGTGGGGGDLELVEDEGDDEDTFQPQKGNVAFACALDGWGFCIGRFAEIYAAKLGASAAALLRGLKMIVGKKGVDGAGKDPEPMFVQFVLKPLWQVYEAALGDGGDRGVLEKVIKSFNLSVLPRELQNRDPKLVLQAVMSRWLPLSEAVLSMSLRISRLMPRREEPAAVTGGGGASEIISESERVRSSVEACDSGDDAPCVAFVSKMFAVPFRMLPAGAAPADDAAGDSEECFLAFARIFSGVFRAGQRVLVLSSLYDPLKRESMEKHIQPAELHSLYLMMGQGLKPVAAASAGNVVAIRGLGRQILKSATLSSTVNCWPFSSLMFQVAPTLKVAIEPSDPADMAALARGLRLLDHADPFVEVTVSSRGEHVLAAAGEVHLERCIKDLKDRFAKVSLEVSPPLVSYRETIEGNAPTPLEALKVVLSGAGDGVVERTTPNGRCLVRVQVMKLPGSLTKVLDDGAAVLGPVLEGKERVAVTGAGGGEHRQSGDSAVEALKKRILDAVDSEVEAASEHLDGDKVERYQSSLLLLLRRMWALGPRHVGPNILLVPPSGAAADYREGILIAGPPQVSERLGFLGGGGGSDSGAQYTAATGAENAGELLSLEAEGLKSIVVSGFQLATAAGPLCEEPMWGLAFLVEAFLFPGVAEQQQQQQQQDLYGQAMTAVKEACRAAVLRSKPRLVEGMYFCELNTTTEHLGPMYAVLSRRRARILKEEMQEGSPLFTVHAYVPVAESFGFADELRRWTSGAASALLVLSHWEALPEDPFFRPPNTARKLIDAVRRRKGLPVEEKVVRHATKQRTLARKV